MKLARDTWLVYERHMSLLLRNRTWLTFALAQPVTYLLLFAPMLKVALSPVGATSYTDAYLVYVPGLLVAMCIIGGMYTGFTLLAELRAGVIERCRVTPINRQALLLGRALREVTQLLVQSLIITLLAIPFGLRAVIWHVLLAYLLLALLALMATTLSYQIAMSVRNEGALGPMMNTVIQPVMLLSGVLLPLAIAPTWIQRIGDFNPFAWATNSMRAIFRGDVDDAVVWQGAAIVLALAVVAVAWSSRQFSKTVR
jgi:ABC-2 type transport system permease protein